MSNDYLSRLKEHFAGLATSSSGEGRISIPNPCPPSLCTLGEFVDPFEQRYTLIVLNDTGRQLLTVSLVLVSFACGTFLLLFLLRGAVRHSSRALQGLKDLVHEETYRAEAPSKYMLAAPADASGSLSGPSIDKSSRKSRYTALSPIHILE